MRIEELLVVDRGQWNEICINIKLFSMLRNYWNLYLNLQ